MNQRRTKRKKRLFAKDVAKGAAKGLGRLGTGAVKGVVGELTSILTLALYRRPRR